MKIKHPEARVETNPEKLKALNDEIKSKKDRDLDFVFHPFDYVANLFIGAFGCDSRKYYSNNGHPNTYRPFGNFLQRPLLDTKFSHLGSTWFTMQDHKWPRHCRIMERDYFRCLARVGLQNSEKWCQIYWEDVFECSTHEKSNKRVATIKRARKQQGLKPPEIEPAIY